MKRASILLAPPLAFVLAALLAWLAGSPAGKTIALDDNVLRSPRQREVAATSSGDPAAIAAQFENEMLIYRAPRKQIHDSEWMEGVVAGERTGRNSFVLGCSTYEFECTLQWAEESPAEMFVWLIHQGGSDFREREGPASTLFENWAIKDMEAALGAAFKITNTNIRRKALASSLEVLCQSNPDRARELMMQNLGLFPPDLEGSLFKPYGTAKATCDLLLSLPPGEERTHLLADLLTGMANWSIGEESKNAISIWKQAPESLRQELAEAGFTCGKDNAASFDGLVDLMRERAEKSGDPRSAEKFMEIHGPVWAKRDLGGAMDWAQAHLKGKARVERSAGLFESAASQDFDMALATWQTLPDGILKDRAAGAMSKGAPPNRKTEAEAVVQSLSERDRDLAR